MTYRVSDFYEALDKLAPFDTALEWDNSGLLAGSPETQVQGALVALDASAEALDEALELGANLIISHHPVIFPSIKQISGHSTLYRIIENSISVICAHTNLDISCVNKELCARLRLTNARPLESPALIGELERPMEPGELAAFVKESLGAGAVKYTAGGTVTTVAVCGGSGADLLDAAIAGGAQALVTSEAKHHLLLQARESGFTLIDAGHYATEAVVVPRLAELLRESLPGVRITASSAQRDPAFYL